MKQLNIKLKKMEQLMYRNAHRAKTVRRIGESEVLPFTMKPGSIYGIMDYFAGDVKVSKYDFKEWEVVEFRYDVTLDEYWEKAQSAFRNTSFSSDYKGQRAIADCEYQMNDDIKGMCEEDKERYIAVYKTHFSTWMSAESRCASSFITGGSNFNTSRAEKARNSNQNVSDKFILWREKFLAAIKKREQDLTESLKTDEQKADEEWESQKRFIDNKCVKANIFSRIERTAYSGNVALTERSVEYVRERKIFTERHKVFTLVDIAKRVAENMEASAKKENEEVDFIGGKLVLNFAEERIQLIFDDKPCSDFISQLKRKAFRWSPRLGAWQRQNTSNGIYAATEFIRDNNLIKK